MSKEIVDNQDVELEEETNEEELEDEVEEQDSDTDDSNDDLAETLKEKEAKIKELEELIIRNKKKDKKPQNKPQNTDDDDDLTERLSSVELNQQKWNFGVENNLEPKVVEELYKTFGRIPTRNEMKSPIVKSAIQGAKKQFKVSSNTPGSKPAGSGLVDENFSKMTKAEKQARYEKIVKDRYSK